jgi:hypothetical protein
LNLVNGVPKPNTSRTHRLHQRLQRVEAISKGPDSIAAVARSILKTRLPPIIFPVVTSYLFGAKFMKVLISGACLCLLIASVGPLHAEAPSYTNDVLPFLNRCCAECHQGKGKGGVSVDTYASLMKGGKKGRQAVVPGQPDKSLLVLAVEGKTDKKMPPKKAAAQPTAEEIAALRAWIKAGAKDDTPKKSSLDGGTEEYLTLPGAHLRTSSMAMADASFLPNGKTPYHGRHSHALSIAASDSSSTSR